MKSKPIAYLTIFLVYLVTVGSIKTEAATTDTAQCASDAFNGPFSRDQAAALCENATPSTAKCATDAFNGPFSRNQAMKLCQQNATPNTAKCATDAFDNGSNRDQAVERCSSTIDSNAASIKQCIKSVMYDKDGSRTDISDVAAAIACKKNW